MTSDTHRKEVAVEFALSGKKVRIGGVCKGAGMIQPGMSSSGKRPAAMPLHATMLGFITTDANVSKPVLKLALKEAVAQSFNRITVDGDMSTNDTVLILANGKAQNPRIDQNLIKGSPQDFEKFQSALNYVTLELAKKIVRDGEGVSRFVTVRVTGARNQSEADQAARAVANSALVKTSWCGGDPNWGRILDALGYSPAKIVEEKIDLGYSLPQSRKIVYSLKKGQPTKVSFKDLCNLVANKDFELHINLNLGKGSAVIYAADLTEAYVDFNKGSIGDPSAMGG
jgi:glutamate N-acetyltransferase/amino-acid N-acetyltransferase